MPKGKGYVARKNKSLPTKKAFNKQRKKALKQNRKSMKKK